MNSRVQCFGASQREMKTEKQSVSIVRVASFIGGLGKALVVGALVGTGIMPATLDAEPDRIVLTPYFGDNNQDLTLIHKAGYSDGFDASPIDITYGPPPMLVGNQWNVAGVTAPYGTRLSKDSRGDTSETAFIGSLRVINLESNGLSLHGFVNFAFPTNSVFPIGPLSNRLYLAQFAIPSQYSTNGQQQVHTTNIVNLVTAQDGNLHLEFANISLGTNDLIPFTVSCVFTNQLRAVGNHTSSTNGLSLNQVSGLEYVVTSDTNNGPAYISQGTNLVYAPTLGFVGTNNVNVQLRWPVGTANVLGDINYQFIVTNMNTAPVALSVTNSGLAGTPIQINLKTNASDPDAGDTNLSFFIASVPPDGVLVADGMPTNVTFTSGINAYGLLSGQYGVTDGQATNYGSFVFAVAPVSRAPRLLAVRKRTNDTLELDALVQQNRSVKVEARFWDAPAWTPVLTNRIPYGDSPTNIFWTLTNVPMGCEGIVVPEEGTNYGKYIRLKSVAD